jgi:F-type H+-transporting ATPase subunit a
MKHIKKYLLMLLLALSAMPGFAEKKNIDMKEILWGHIKDSYEWHVTNIGKTPIVFHLPIIVKSSTGWHVFCSSEFSEEPDALGNRPGPYGLYIKSAKDEKYPSKIVEKVGNDEIRPLDLSITKTVCVLFIDAFILLLCVLIPARWCRKHKVDDAAPSGFVGLMHMFIMSVYDDVIKPVMGDEADKYAPYLLTCFFFIFTANIMGIVPFPPGGGNLTGNIACTCFFGVATFLVTNLTGTRDYWKEIFWGDVPTWLKVPVPLMPVIELFGIFTKPLALIIRLFANMMAGHAIALAFAGMIFIMFHLTTSDVVNNVAGSGMSVISVSLSIFMMLLEILVSYIQALVFTMLSAVFISQAHVKEHE